MIYWITGNTGAGKTTLAKWMRSLNPQTIILDGNDLRTVWHDLNLSWGGRWEQGIRVARLANILHKQAQTIVVAVICPYHKLRKEVQKICNCKFIYLHGGKESSEEFPYDYRGEDEYEENL